MTRRRTFLAALVFAPLSCLAQQPASTTAHGEIGLTQVRPELHGIEPASLIDPRVSLAAGAHILRSCIARAGGDVQRGFAFYNDRGEAAERYAEKVLRARQRLAA